MLLAAPRSMQDLSSPTRDGTCAPCSGSSESKPLDRQGIRAQYIFKKWMRSLPRLSLLNTKRDKHTNIISNLQHGKIHILTVTK